ncbi:lincosamide nucleotidyltransferase Lnu(P), partial [Clostridium saudiense]|nr:lincosamide nucleotidyltransferase Lnu(P) [Clostridium saudiense]
YNNNIEIWLDGGWGVDALLGKETRQHNDIDLFVEEKNYNKFIEIIKNKGFNEIVVEYTSEVHTIWSDNKLRIIDLHMFKDNCDGTICYEGEVFQKNIFDGVGKIGNIMVSCINAKNQVLFHLGYEFGESDIHD